MDRECLYGEEKRKVKFIHCNDTAASHVVLLSFWAFFAGVSVN